MTDSSCARQADLLNRYPWPQLQRLRFIDAIAAEYGYIGRPILMAYFGMSEPQASLDISTYRELAPDNLQYDPSMRRYTVKDAFQRLFV